MSVNSMLNFMEISRIEFLASRVEVDGQMKNDVRVAGGTADIETGIFLIIKLSLCLIAFYIYKCINTSLFLNNAVFCSQISYQSVRNPAC